MSIRRLFPECNLETVQDGRGGIFTYYPQDPILEWNLLFTAKGHARGFHFHKEFDEYILVVSGHGTYVQRETDGHEEFVLVSAGDCLHFQAGTPHTVHAITDLRMVALLTKRWDACAEPMTRIDTT
jgi:mannose-6-phosphate isomerase-like protein (cupin superfamily)